MPSRQTIAVIDVGSNSVRLLVARQLSGEAFEVVDEARFDARLAEGQAGGDLQPEGMERGLRAFRVMAEVARSHNPENTIAVGTEALRRAPNAALFMAEAHRQTGLRIRVLTGEDEAYAGFLGVVNSTSLSDGLVLDIGGGSLELMEVAGRELRTVQSAPLGAIYARERFFRSDPPSPRDLRALRKAVTAAFRVPPGSHELHGAGGAVRNLARIVRLRREYPLKRLHGFAIERREVRALARRLPGLTPEERRRFPGLSANRADTLPAAAVVIDQVMELAGARRLLVSGQGLREGLAWEHFRPRAPVLPDVRAASIAGLALANGVNARQAAPIAEAALALFDASRAVHGLADADAGLLASAARLAAIGMHIDFYNRDRHAEYLVHSGDLHGFSHREIVLLAALVRCADGGSPDLSPFRAIVEPEDTRRATILAATLGMARAIRRRTPSPVLHVSASITGDAFTIELVAHEPLDAELLECERQSRRLESALRMPVHVSQRPTAESVGA